MSILLRFEDKYGISDLFQKCRYDHFITNTSEAGIIPDLVKLKDGLILSCNLGINGVIKFDNTDVDFIDENNVTDIVFIFDLDNIKGDKSKLIEIEDIKEYLEYAHKILEENNVHVNLHFVPVTYAAETLCLYLFMVRELDPVKIVNNKNTNKVHSALLTGILRKSHIKKIKNLREELTPIDIEMCLERELNLNRHNQHLIRWLLNKGSVLENTLSEEELYRFIEDTTNEFEEFKRNEDTTIYVAGHKVDVSSFHQLDKFIKDRYEKGLNHEC